MLVLVLVRTSQGSEVHVISILTASERFLWTSMVIIFKRDVFWY